MTGQDFTNKVNDLKKEVLNEVKTLLKTNARHDFKNPFYVHFIDRDVATTELCTAVEVSERGDFIMYIQRDGYFAEEIKDETISEEEILNYTATTFADIIDNLKNEIN